MTASKLNTPQPKIFIGSSSEALEIANSVKVELLHYADAYLWSEANIFGVGDVTIESLEEVVQKIPYAIFVMSPDDITIERKKKYPTPRDNLLFELGLWAGKHSRHSVFMIVPLGEKVHLPSDLSGITVGEYKRRMDSDESTPFDVSAACIKIINAIKKIETPRRAQTAAHEKFWKGLADRVVILYGVESGGDVDSIKRPRVSLRDLDTMTHILRFLTRWYPHKQVIPLRAGTPVLPDMLQEGTDLIIIGGFITNEMFAKYQANYKGSYRLEMGGLSKIDETRVFHVSFGNVPPGISAPPGDDPQAIEDFPSEYVSRDYGHVTSSTTDTYGKRRVITIAGIKGNGTRGAAMALTGITSLQPGLDTILKSTLTENDSLELVIASDVSNDHVYRTELVDLALNGKHKKLSNKHLMLLRLTPVDQFGQG